MDALPSQLIERFVKINHILYCAIAYAERDIENFCRHFLFAVMDRQNRISFKVPITRVIHELTMWDKNYIKKTLQRLTSRKEFIRRGHKLIIFNPLFANRVKKVTTSRFGYDGEDPQLSEAQLKLAEEIARLIKLNPNDSHTEEDENMVAVMKEMQELRQAVETLQKGLDFLIKRATKEDAETARTMLKLVHSEPSKKKK